MEVDEDVWGGPSAPDATGTRGEVRARWCPGGLADPCGPGPLLGFLRPTSTQLSGHIPWGGGDGALTSSVTHHSPLPGTAPLSRP